MSLFRVVQREEMQDLLTRGAFRTVANSIEGKQFWTTREDAERFMRLVSTRWGIRPNWVIEVVVEASVPGRLEHLTLDGRPAWMVHDAELDWFKWCRHEHDRLFEARGLG